MQSRLLLRLATCATLAFLSSTGATTAQTASAGDEYIAQPEGWVPFSAEFTRYDAAGRVAYVGRAIMELKTPGGIVRRPGVKISLLVDDGTSAKMTLIGDTRIDGGDATVALKDATTIAVKVSVEDQTWRVAIVKLFEVGRDTDGSPTEKPAGEFELQVGTAKHVSIAGHRVQVTVDRIGRRTR